MRSRDHAVLALGLLSILQVAVLPGLIGVLLLRLHDGLLRALCLGFVLSVFFNYGLVLILCAARLYGPAAVFIVTGMEIVVLAWLARRRGLGAPLRGDLERARALLARIGAMPPARRLLAALAMVVAVGALGYTLVEGAASAGKSFAEWDTVVSWNRFALDWYAGTPARKAWTYPQLLPAAYSTTYVFLGTSEVQFFARAVAALFPLAMCGAMLDLALRLQNAGYLLSIGAVRWVMTAMIGKYLMCGSADDPVASVIFIAVSCVVLAAEAGPDRMRLLIAGGLCVGAAAATKQQGCVLAAAYPGLVWMALGVSPAAPARKRIAMAAWLMLIPAIAVGPWYLYCAFEKTSWGMGYIAVGIHAGRGLLERAAFAFDEAYQASSVRAGVLEAMTAVLLVMALAHRTWRWVVVLVGAPLLGLWMLMLGYDTRNVAAVIPLLLTGAGQGFGAITARLGRSAWSRPRPALGYGLIALGAIGIVAVLGLTRWRASHLRAESQVQRMQAVQPEINAALYRLTSQPGYTGQVLSNYQPMEYLPGLGSLYRYDPLSVEEGMDAKLADPRLSHVLFLCFGPLPECLQRRVTSGRLTLVEQAPRYSLFRIEPRGERREGGPAPGP